MKLNKNKKNRGIKAARLTVDFSAYTPWSGAVDTWDNLEKFGKIDLLEQILDDAYYNESIGEALMTETELNDLLWFEPETVYEWVGLYYNDDTGEVSDEPFDDEDYDDIESSTVPKRKRTIKANRSIRSKSRSRRPVKAAESYGWVVEDWEAQEAYGFAIDSGWWDEESLNADIVKAISSEELAACLAFIFRVNDFQAWDERNEEDEDDIEESYRIKGKKSIRANKARRNRKSIKAAWGGWNKFYGLNDVEFTVPNDTDDPTIFYDGNYYNYYDIEDTLWSYYKEDCEVNGVVPDESGFDDWVSENSYLVYETLDIANPKSKPGRGVYRKQPGML